MSERNLCIRVDEEFYRKIKVRIAQEGKTLKEYLVELIEKDLEAQK